jgi:hypothetical protein
MAMDVALRAKCIARDTFEVLESTEEHHPLPGSSTLYGGKYIEFCKARFVNQVHNALDTSWKKGRFGVFCVSALWRPQVEG